MLVKIPARFFDISNLILKSKWKETDIKIVKTILKIISGRNHSTDIKGYYIAIAAEVAKAV